MQLVWTIPGCGIGEMPRRPRWYTTLAIGVPHPCLGSVNAARRPLEGKINAVPLRGTHHFSEKGLDYVAGRLIPFFAGPLVSPEQIHAELDIGHKRRAVTSEGRPFSKTVNLHYLYVQRDFA